jgi:hypothetical protein
MQTKPKTKHAKAAKANAEPKPIPALTVHSFIFGMEDGKKTVREFATTLALLSEAMEEHIGVIVQRLASDIIKAQRQVDEQTSMLFKLAGGKG